MADLRAHRAETEAALAAKEAVKAIREREECYQAMFDALVILGFDMDGDTKPHALIAGMGHAGFVQMFMTDVRDHRQQDEDDWSTG